MPEKIWAIKIEDKKPRKGVSDITKRRKFLNDTVAFCPSCEWRAHLAQWQLSMSSGTLIEMHGELKPLEGA